MNNKQNTTADHPTHEEDAFTLAHKDVIRAIRALEDKLVKKELYEIAAECHKIENEAKEIKKIKESIN